MPPHADLASWLRLAAIPGVGGETQRALLAAFGLPENIFCSGASALARVVAEPTVEQLLRHDTSAAVETALSWAEVAGNRIVTLADPDYPRRLLETPDPPTLLYAKGRVALLNAPALAIVGSRNATPQGVANAEAFGAAMADAGLTVVSGLALGIDAAAHRGGLRGRASTIAVIGTGIDRIYPAKNRDLAREIAERGVIVSEFHLGTPPLKENFPRRNRVISGLALGCLVIEAAERSGSLITARLASEQGRDVFAVPGSIHSPLSKGCHRLIKQGAKLVDDARDILDELGIAGTAPTRLPERSADVATRALLDSMGFDPCDLDTLATRAGLTTDTLYAMLLPLELEGLVASLPGGRVQRLSEF